MDRWAVGGATVALSVTDRRANLEWTGPMTRRLLHTLVPELVRALDRTDTDVLLADLKRATLAVTPEEVVEFFRSPATSALLRPGALLVDEDTLPMARETCGRLAVLGVIRAAFTDYGAASRWALEMGRVVQAEQAWQERALARSVLGSLQTLRALSARKSPGSQQKLSSSPG